MHAGHFYSLYLVLRTLISLPPSFHLTAFLSPLLIFSFFDMTITSIYDQLVPFITRNLIGGKPINFDDSEESDTAASNFHAADHLQSPVQL